MRFSWRPSAQEEPPSAVGIGRLQAPKAAKLGGGEEETMHTCPGRLRRPDEVLVFDSGLEASRAGGGPTAGGMQQVLRGCV